MMQICRVSWTNQMNCNDCDGDVCPLQHCSTSAEISLTFSCRTQSSLRSLQLQIATAAAPPRPALLQHSEPRRACQWWGPAPAPAAAAGTVSPRATRASLAACLLSCSSGETSNVSKLELSTNWEPRPNFTSAYRGLTIVKSVLAIFNQ